MPASKPIKVHQISTHIDTTDRGLYVIIGVLSGVAIILMVVFCPIVYRILKNTFMYAIEEAKEKELDVLPT